MMRLSMSMPLMILRGAGLTPLGARRDADNGKLRRAFGDDIELDALAGRHALEQCLVLDREVHGHCRPVKRGDCAVLELDGAGLQVDRTYRAFAFMHRAGSGSGLCGSRGI